MAKKLKCELILFLLFSGVCFAAPMFIGAGGGSSGGGGSSSITLDSNWTTFNQNRTLTVPAGNPGTLKFTGVSCDVACQYSKNSAAYVTFVTNDTLAVANGDTLKLKDSTNAGMNTTVIDNTTMATVGVASF